MLRYFHEWQIVEISYEQICQHIKKTISKLLLLTNSSLFDDMKNYSVFGLNRNGLTKGLMLTVKCTCKNWNEQFVKIFFLRNVSRNLMLMFGIIHQLNKKKYFLFSLKKSLLCFSFNINDLWRILRIYFWIQFKIRNFIIVIKTGYVLVLLWMFIFRHSKNLLYRKDVKWLLKPILKTISELYSRARSGEQSFYP